jgi:hypothetical protein
MSNSEIIYQNIITSQYFSGIISPDVKEYHKSIIDVFLNYKFGTTTVNLWDKLDFFYFFDTDNESLKYINWKNPNLPTASLGNDNFAISYNYNYLGPAQDQIAKWWDGKSTPFGDKNSVFNDKTLSYAWSASTGLGISLAGGSGSYQNTGLVKTFLDRNNIPLNGTGSFPDTLVDGTPYGVFDVTPFSSSFGYQYSVRAFIKTVPPVTYNSPKSYNNNSVTLNIPNISGDTTTYSATRNYASQPYLSVQVLQNPLRHRVTAYTPSYVLIKKGNDVVPDVISPVVQADILYYDSFNSRSTNPFKNGYGTNFGLINYYSNIFQNWILDNNYLPNIIRYPNYHQLLELKNGTYFNTNFNFKQNITNYQLNDGFVGFLKMGLGGGVETRLRQSPFTRTINTISGSLYVGVADSEVSNNSLVIKLNKQYFTASTLNTGYQSGLGVSLTSSTSYINYTWKAYTGSNPYPFSSYTPGNNDFLGYEVTASNESSRAGRPGLYISQRVTSQGNANISQYYNNMIPSTSSVSILTGDIPDGKFLLNGMGSPSYVESNYVISTDEQYITKSLATINSVSSGSFFGSVSYTSSGLINNIQETSTNVLTYYTGSYNQQTGLGEQQSYYDYLPNSITNGKSFIIDFSIENSGISLPEINDEIHIGYQDNQIGVVQEISKFQYTTETNDYIYRIVGIATKTTSSGINNGNSTIVRFYENNYLSIGSQFNSRNRKVLYNTVISGSGINTTSSFLNNVFAIYPLNNEIVQYPFSGTNSLPRQSITFNSGSNFELIISSSSPLYPEIASGNGWKLSTPSGSQTYTGPEFGVTYFTDFTGTYTTSSNDLESIFITNNTGNITYSNNYFLTNGTYYLQEPSISGQTFQFRYSSSFQNSQLSGITTNSLFKITTLNPDYGSKYFTPDGEDLKTYNRQSDSFMMAFAGGGIGNVNLRYLYKQLFDVIYPRSQYKVTGLPIFNFNSSSLLPASSVIYPSGLTTNQQKIRWYAATDVQDNVSGYVNLYGTDLFNPFSFTGNFYNDNI